MRKKIFFTVISFILFVTVVISGFSISTIDDNYRQMVQEKLKSDSIVIRDYAVGTKETDFPQVARKLGKELGLRITFVNRQGRVLGDSMADEKTMENHSNRPEIQRALQKGFGQSIRFSKTLQARLMYVAIPLDDNQGVVRLSMTLKSIWSGAQKVWINVLIIALISLLFDLYLAYRFSVNVTEPMEEIIRVTDQFSHGHFEQRIRIQPKDEIGKLADTFNQMAEQIQQFIGELMDKNGKIEAILSAMINGIVAVDRHMKIIMINPAAYRLLSINCEAMERHFLEVIRNTQVENLLKGAIHHESLSSVELSFYKGEEKIYKVYVVPMKKGKEIIGAVTLINDITQIKKLEQMRSDFVANVSHELKTPLTSIKGFVETLQEGAISEKNTALHFLDIINIEADRLTRLINDILSLSEIESHKNNILMERLDVTQITGEIIEIMRSYSINKNIELRYENTEGPMWVKGDYDRVKQMLINLVDNAVKYTPSGGKVSVWLKEKENKIYIHISDTGIGIAEEHIHRLFERFYRVDKGRSRRLGGTGLGLAIVKHIVKSMNGDIRVISEVGKGSEFIIELPKDV